MVWPSSIFLKCAPSNRSLCNGPMLKRLPPTQFSSMSLLQQPIRKSDLDQI